MKGWPEACPGAPISPWETLSGRPAISFPQGRVSLGENYPSPAWLPEQGERPPGVSLTSAPSLLLPCPFPSELHLPLINGRRKLLSQRKGHCPSHRTRAHPRGARAAPGAHRAQPLPRSSPGSALTGLLSICASGGSSLWASSRCRCRRRPRGRSPGWTPNLWMIS